MFRDMNKIPQTEQEAYDNQIALSDIYNELNKYIPGDNASYRWNAYPATSVIMKILNLASTLNVRNDNRVLFLYTVNRNQRFEDTITRAKDSQDFGLIINQEVSTHYREEFYGQYRRMEAVEQILKQTPQHFLRIHSVTDTIISVYTNKMLLPTDLYKLSELVTNLYEKKHNDLSDFPKDLINACVSNNFSKFKSTIEDFLKSDLIMQLKLEKVKKVFNYEKDHQIHALERTIENLRSDIQQYENYLIECGRKIREHNENIIRLRTTDYDEECEIVCKYLDRSPYIKEYRPSGNSYMILSYEAPLIYFNESAAEKLLENERLYPQTQKDILRMIIEGEFQLYTQCQLEFNTATYSAGIRDVGNGPLLAHPHIDRYHCFGNHRDSLSESAECGDYLGALEQLTQAVLNINFYDGTVTNWMLATLEDIQHSLITWKDTTTGEMISTYEALKRRKERRNEETTSE